MDEVTHKAFNAVDRHLRTRSVQPDPSAAPQRNGARPKDRLDPADLAAIALKHPNVDFEALQRTGEAFQRGPISRLHTTRIDAKPEVAFERLTQTLSTLPPKDRTAYLNGEGIELLRLALQGGKPWRDVVSAIRSQVSKERAAIDFERVALRSKQEIADLFGRVGDAAKEDVQDARGRLEAWSKQLDGLKDKKLAAQLKSWVNAVKEDPAMPILVSSAAALSMVLGGDPGDAVLWATVMAAGMKGMDFALDDDVWGIIPNVQKLVNPAWEGSVLAGATNLPEGSVGTSLAKNPSVGTNEAMGVSLSSNAANVLLWGLATTSAFPRMVGEYRDDAEAQTGSRPTWGRSATEMMLHVVQEGGDKLAWAAGFATLATAFLGNPEMDGASLIAWGATAATAVGIYVSTNLLGTRAKADAAVRDLEPDQLQHFRALWSQHVGEDGHPEVDALFDTMKELMDSLKLDPENPPSRQLLEKLGRTLNKILSYFGAKAPEPSPSDRLVTALQAVVEKSQNDPEFRAELSTFEMDLTGLPDGEAARGRELVKLLQSLGVKGLQGPGFDPWTAAKLVPGAGMMVGAASVVTAGATGLGPAVGLPLMMISGLLAFMSSWPEFSTMKSLLAQREVRKSVDVASGSNAINLILALGVMGMRGGKL
jgi:hypothetical protein